MARDFNGSTDRIDWASLGNLTGHAATISMWVYMDTENANDLMFCAHDSGNTVYGFVVNTYYSAPNYGYVRYYAHGSTDLAHGTQANALTTGTWIHILITRPAAFTDSSAINIYINGSEPSSLVDVNGITETAHTGSWSLGGRIYDDLRNFDGKLAEVAVWDTVLSTGTMSALAAGNAPSFYPTNLLFYYSGRTDSTSAEVGGAAATVDGTSYSALHPTITYPTLEDSLTLGRFDGISFSTTPVVEGSISLSRVEGISTSLTSIQEASISLGRILGLSLQPFVPRFIDDIVLEWVSSNTYEDTITLNRLVGLTDSATSDLSALLTLSRSEGISTVTTQVIESLLFLQSALGITSTAEGILESNFSLQKQLSVANLSLISLEDVISLGRTLAVAYSVDQVVEGSVALDRQLGLSSSANAIFETAISLAYQLALSTEGNITFEEAVSLLQAFALSTLSEVGTQTYEEAMTLARNLAISTSVLSTLGVSVDLSHQMSLSMETIATLFSTISLEHTLELSITGGLLISAAFDLSLSQGEENQTTVTMEESIGLTTGLDLSEQPTADYLVQLSLGKTVTLSPIATAEMVEDITLGKVLEITFQGGLQYDENVTLDIFQALSLVDQLLAALANFPAKLVVGDKTIWILTAHDSLSTQTDIIDTDEL